MKDTALIKILIVIVLFVSSSTILVLFWLNQQLEDQVDELKGLRHDFDQVNKNVDDILWYKKLEDIAFIDKVELTGPSVGIDKKLSLGSLDSMYLTNPYRIKTYVFIPLNLDRNQKYPLVVFPHGGVHSNFGSNYSHIVAELILQGYIVTAPEYRGSTGYGQNYYKSIDYGGLENADVKACRDYMVHSYDFIDNSRVGILGWSHGGMITLMNLFQYPDQYQVGYAGVPVSDLVHRLSYKNQSYENLYSADYHVGKTLREDTMEYRRRSPTSYVSQLKAPLLIHTNTNDSDVRSHEVEKVIDALKAVNKDFQYEIFQNLPGGHRFDRMDILQSRELRFKAYAFLGNVLMPASPFSSYDDLSKQSYYPPSYSK